MDIIEKMIAESRARQERYTTASVMECVGITGDAIIMEPRFRDALEVAARELRNIATRGDNCDCAAHGWAKAAREKIEAILEAKP